MRVTIWNINALINNKEFNNFVEEPTSPDTLKLTISSEVDKTTHAEFIYPKTSSKKDNGIRFM